MLTSFLGATVVDTSCFLLSYFADNVRDDYAAGQLDAQVRHLIIVNELLILLHI